VTQHITPEYLAGMFHAHPSLPAEDVNSLLRLGVASETLFKPFPLRTGRVAWADAETFIFEEHLNFEVEVERIILILIFDCWGQAIDIAGWNPHSGRFGTWRNRAWALGEGSAFAPRLSEHGALPMWRTPLNWLVACRKGVVLFQPRLAAAFLCDAGPLLAEDLEHAHELKKQLTRPSPRILIPSCSLRGSNHGFPGR
jgi:hypothetical protein